MPSPPGTSRRLTRSMPLPSSRTPSSRSRSSTRTARCAPATPRSSTARARRPRRWSLRSRRCRATGPCWSPARRPTMVDALLAAYDEVVVEGGTVAVGPLPEPRGHVAVVAAGTSDGPVAAEAALTVRAFGAGVERVDDVGVVRAAPADRRASRAGPRGLPRRRRRDGGRAALGARRAGRDADGRRAHQRRLRRDASAASRRCWPCSTPARPASPWSTSTTASGPASSLPGSPAGSARVIGWLDCAAGASGDMLLGALVDAGVDLAVLQSAVDCGRVPGIALRVEAVTRRGLGATRVHVDTTDTARPGPGPTSAPCWSRRRSPSRCGRSRWTSSPGSPRPRRRCTGSPRTRCTSTRSGRWTRSLTSSAPQPACAPSGLTALTASPGVAGIGQHPRRARPAARAGSRPCSPCWPGCRSRPALRRTRCARRPVQRCSPPWSTTGARSRR